MSALRSSSSSCDGSIALGARHATCSRSDGPAGASVSMRSSWLKLGMMGMPSGAKCVLEVDEKEVGTEDAPPAKKLKPETEE